MFLPRYIGKKFCNFLGLISILFTKSYLRPKFINVKPNSKKYLNYSLGNWGRTFAYSKYENKDFEIELYRLINSDSPPGSGQGVLIRSSAKNYNFIALAEDPRVFNFQDKIFIYYQIFNHTKNDCDLYLLDILNHQTYQIVSPYNLTGKNWSFFDDNNVLICLYSIEPLIVLEGEIDYDNLLVRFSPIQNENELDLVWGEGNSTHIGEIRGGTPFIRINESIWLSFTHSTPIGDKREQHSLGCAIINMKSSELIHLPLTEQRLNLLVDPYGLVKFQSKVGVFLSVGTGHPGRENEYFCAQKIDYDLNNLSAECIKSGNIVSKINEKVFHKIR
jgi:hypothetical protein